MRLRCAALGGFLTGYRRITRVAVAAGLLVLVGAVGSASAANLLGNGGFESGTTGWKGTNATIASVTEAGVPEGTHAGKVTATAAATYRVFTNPRVGSTSAGNIYTANGQFRSDVTPGKSICLQFREYSAGGSSLQSKKTCKTATTSWASFSQLSLTAKQSGSTLRLDVYQASGTKGQTFEVDALDIEGAAPPPPDPVIAAAGDIACPPGAAVTATTCHQDGVSNLMFGAGLAAVLPLGDDQYNCGLAGEFAAYDAGWGRLNSIVHPVPGNHEYGDTSDGGSCTPSLATDYFNYFGSAAGTPGQGWYSYDIGSWHLIALNSELCVQSGCGPGTAQYDFLSGDLASTTKSCVLAYWHHPLFASGLSQDTPAVKPLWDLLYAAHADVVLNGHKHIYERFSLQDPSGNLDAAGGIREFIVGTGGYNHGPIGGTQVNSQKRNNDSFGVLDLTLHAASYDWSFVRDTTASGTLTDSGSQACH